MDLSVDPGRTVAAQYGRMGGAQQQQVQAAVLEAAAALHAAYSSFTLHTPPCWLQALDQAALRQVHAAREHMDCASGSLFPQCEVAGATHDAGMCHQLEWRVSGAAWCLQMLDKLFMTYLLLTSAIWEGAAAGGLQARQEAAVLVLDVAANLHFCRMRLSSYATLIQVPYSRRATLEQYYQGKQYYEGTLRLPHRSCRASFEFTDVMFSP